MTRLIILLSIFLTSCRSHLSIREGNKVFVREQASKVTKSNLKSYKVKNRPNKVRKHRNDIKKRLYLH